MHSTDVKHTLNIFQKLCQQLPPLVPEKVRSDMKSAAEQLEHNYGLALDELEDTMIVFGSKFGLIGRPFRSFWMFMQGNWAKVFCCKSFHLD
jgi:hypothetical protein